MSVGVCVRIYARMCADAADACLCVFVCVCERACACACVCACVKVAVCTWPAEACVNSSGELEA